MYNIFVAEIIIGTVKTETEAQEICEKLAHILIAPASYKKIN